MKIKTITAVAFSLIAVNTYAYQGENFKIISEKVTQSPGFNGGIISHDSPMPRTFSAEALAWAHDSSGRPMEYIKIQGDHNVSLYNSTAQNKRYTYTYVLSCENAYQNVERTVELYPHGNFTDSSHSYGTVQKDNEGTYGVNVQTRVSGSESAYHEAHATLRVRR